MSRLCDARPCLNSCSSSIVYQEIRREEERAATIAAAKEKQKKEEAKRREERRSAAKSAASRSSERSVTDAAELQCTKVIIEYKDLHASFTVAYHNLIER